MDHKNSMNSDFFSEWVFFYHISSLKRKTMLKKNKIKQAIEKIKHVCVLINFFTNLYPIFYISLYLSLSCQ